MVTLHRDGRIYMTSLRRNLLKTFSEQFVEKIMKGNLYFNINFLANFLYIC